MEKAELIITALQQRIGELTSNYEMQIAVLRAEITQIIDDQRAKDKATQDYTDSLSEKISNA